MISYIWQSTIMKISCFRRTRLSQQCFTIVLLRLLPLETIYDRFHVSCCLNTKRILKSSFPRAIQCNQEAIFAESRCCTLRPVANYLENRFSTAFHTLLLLLPILWYIKFATVSWTEWSFDKYQGFNVDFEDLMHLTTARESKIPQKAYWEIFISLNRNIIYFQ